jgi:hypothetical protein
LKSDVITTTKECKASTEQEAAILCACFLLKHANGKYTTSHNYRLTAIEYEFANYQGYSDVNPYEIVKVVSPKTLEIRAKQQRTSLGKRFALVASLAQWLISATKNGTSLAIKKTK